jgi:hypothetical protein
MSTKRTDSSSDISRVWKRLDPANYYDPGEVAILRAYFGLRARPGDPSLESLYEAPGEGASDQDSDGRTGPIRLKRVDPGVEACNDLSHAVARICLSSVQDRLPQWGYVTKDDQVVVARHSFPVPDRTFTPLNPQRVLCINWADSGPGFSWPEDYFVTLLPGFGRYVVTASADSTDSYGVLDFAIGWFRSSVDPVVGSRRVLTRWWRTARSSEGSPWAYLFNTGLIDEDEANRMRRSVWGREVA